MLSRTKRSLLLAAGLLLLVIAGSRPAAAQVQDERWSQPLRISSPNASASIPVIFADQFGLVHLFWVEKTGEFSAAKIVHTIFDGDTWANPVEIHIAPGGRPILHMSASSGGDGRLHLLWTEGEAGPVFYSSAPGGEALSVRQWDQPIRLNLSTYVLEGQVTADGVLHVVYAKPASGQGGLHYQRSEDGGETWSAPARLDPDATSNLSTNILQLRQDANGGLHSTWTYLDANIIGAAGTWVRYARSVDGGDTWSFPTTIDESDLSEDELRIAYPNMAVAGERIAIVYAGDSGVHREFRFSDNLGATWSDNVRILGDLHGQSRGDGMAADGDGRIHFFGSIRWPTGLYHAYFDGQSWSKEELVYLIRLNSQDESGDRIAAHDIRLAILNGNHLVATFGDAPAAPKRGLFVMDRLMEETSGVAAEPTPVPTPTATPEPTPTPMPTSPPPTPIFQDRPQPPVANPNNVGQVLLLGLAPILGILGLVVVARMFLSRN